MDEIKARLEAEARAIHDEDVESVPGDRARSARSWCRRGARILTHCNAGALATAGYGTALGVIRGAVERASR